MRYTIIHTFTIFCVLLISGCNRSPHKPDYQVNMDPSWSSLELPERSGAIKAFTVELLEAISNNQKTSIAIYEVSWDRLMWNLQNEKCNAIVASLQPYLFYDKIYDFSDPYLLVGPTLVVPISTMVSSLEQMNGKEVGIIQGSADALILEKYPEIIQKTYNSVNAALADVVAQNIDGVLIDILTATAYCRDLYQGTLKVALPPLSQESLRLISLHEKSPALIKIFNTGLKQLQANGQYDQIAKKWGVKT